MSASLIASSMCSSKLPIRASSLYTGRTTYTFRLSRSRFMPACSRALAFPLWIRIGRPAREEPGSFLRRRGRPLIQADHVPAGISEPSRDFRSVDPDWLNDLAAVRSDRFHRGLDAVHHDVEQEPGALRGRPAHDPGPAHLAHGIVERGRAVAAAARAPAEHLRVEL